MSIFFGGGENFFFFLKQKVQNAQSMPKFVILMLKLSNSVLFFNIWSAWIKRLNKHSWIIWYAESKYKKKDILEMLKMFQKIAIKRSSQGVWKYRDVNSF